MNALQRFTGALKAFQMQWSGYGWSGRSSSSFYLGPISSTQRDWTNAGYPLRNGAAAICVSWIGQNLRYARPVVRRMVTDEDGNEEEKPDFKHPLVQKLKRPNDHWTWANFLAVTAMDLSLTGEAYWAKEFTGLRIVKNLVPIPSTMIRPEWPRGGPTPEFISHYIYTVDGQEKRLEPEEVVRLIGLPDPEDHRRGWTPLKELPREIATDSEIASYSATIIENMGVAGASFTPDEKAHAAYEIDDNWIARLRAGFEAVTRGAKRGGLVVTPVPGKWEKLGATPEELALDKFGNRPEARICAAFKVPPMVVGLSVGEDQRTYKNMPEARTAAVEECLMPLWAVIADAVNLHLLPDFGDVEREEFGFDFSLVRQLMEDENAKSKRATEEYKAGGITLNEYREKIGQKPVKGPEGDEFHPLSDPSRDVPLPEDQGEPESAGDREATRQNGRRAAANGRNGNGRKALASEDAKALRASFGEKWRARRLEAEKKAAEGVEA